MSAADLVAVLLALACVAATVVLAFASLQCVRILRELRTLVDSLRVETVPLVADLRTTVAQAGDDLERVEGLLDRAESIATTVDTASKLTYKALKPPIVKTMSFFTGASRATKRLRSRRDRDVIEVKGTERRALEGSRQRHSKRKKGVQHA